MKVVLVSRYPRVDTPAWKRAVAERLAEEGMEVHVLYSRAKLSDQAIDGLRENGAGVLRRYLALRGNGDRPSEAPTETLAEHVAANGGQVLRCDRLSDEEAVRDLTALAPDLLVLVGSDLVPARILDVPRLGTINPHYGLLPAYRGMNVTEWSIFHGDPVGVTVHMVDPGIDTGDILMREEIELSPGETFETLRTKHQDLAARLLPQAAIGLRDGTAERTRQHPSEGRQFYRMHPALREVAERRLRAQAASAG